MVTIGFESESYTVDESAGSVTVFVSVQDDVILLDEFFAVVGLITNDGTATGEPRLWA